MCSAQTSHAHMTLKVKTIQNLFNCAENWLLVEVRKGGRGEKVVFDLFGLFALCSLCCFCPH